MHPVARILLDLGLSRNISRPSDGL